MPVAVVLHHALQFGILDGRVLGVEVVYPHIHLGPSFGQHLGLAVLQLGAEVAFAPCPAGLALHQLGFLCHLALLCDGLQKLLVALAEGSSGVARACQTLYAGGVFVGLCAAGFDALLQRVGPLAHCSLAQGQFLEQSLLGALLL